MPSDLEKVGIALNAKDEDVLPISAIRHAPEDDWCGWMIWRGEQAFDDDFFVPLHFSHVGEWVPKLMPYLALPPGYGVVLAPGHEDVWFDESYLTD